MDRAGHGIRYMTHFKRKAFPGVTKVTTPGRRKNHQIAVNQHVGRNTRSQVWSAKKLKMRPGICVSCGKKSRSDDCNWWKYGNGCLREVPLPRVSLLLIAEVPSREFVWAFGGKGLKVGGDIFAIDCHSEKIGIKPVGT